MRFSELFSAMTTAEREALAKKVNTETGYLWQLATRWRGKKPSLDFMNKLVDADDRLTLGDLAQEFSEPAPVAQAKAA